MGAFATALRRRHFFQPDKNNLAAGTVQETVAKLGEIFRANVGYNPIHGMGTHGFHPSLACQFKGMRKKIQEKFNRKPYRCVFIENSTELQNSYR